MQIRKELGKIKMVLFGEGGYQEAMIGLSIEIAGKGWGVSAPFQGFWRGERSEYCKWTEESRVKTLGEMVLAIDKLLTAAKVRYLHELEGVPVECTFEGNTLKEYRVLEEVL